MQFKNVHSFSLILICKGYTLNEEPVNYTCLQQQLSLSRIIV